MMSSRVQKADVHAHMFTKLKDSKFTGGHYTNVAGNIDYVGAFESALPSKGKTAPATRQAELEIDKEKKHEEGDHEQRRHLATEEGRQRQQLSAQRRAVDSDPRREINHTERETTGSRGIIYDDKALHNLVKGAQ
ncbi:hypothetical protein K443DRAFT_13028 [Laccaria amethystina LaAM-08-1]|uniref:Unplaced genomic scaffold K443scaffold_323, whole genome shotgun sequence n=1 Tax=Laccaria amethystina LaAM-08-1 TaxID=1095629 RepID=A0A0C9WIM6_9AGAR|nr:hypothetical protein K443DRAFT_13028 [Laccaria amethystina LaAM-08-1]